MSSWTWVHLNFVHLMWPALALAAFMAYREIAHRSELGRFISPQMQKRLATKVSLERKLVRVVFVFATLAFGIVALMRPQSQGTKQVSAQRVSADIVVAFDVSKSMLAEDAAPNRLTRAKSEISRMLDKLAGHRVALVAFAGKAVALSPLTPDYGFFRLMLRGASPTSISRGGTAIGEAIRTSLETFDNDGGAASRLLLLITDGEDHQQDAEEAAKLAKDAGVKIVAIGLGSEEGSEIRITDPATGIQEVIKDREGNPVLSKVDGALLQKIAEITEGAYIPAKVAALDLQSIVDEHIEPIFEEAAIDSNRRAPGEKYHWFVLLSLLCLVMSSLLTIHTGRNSHHA